MLLVLISAGLGSTGCSLLGWNSRPLTLGPDDTLSLILVSSDDFSDQPGAPPFDTLSRTFSDWPVDIILMQGINNQIGRGFLRKDLQWLAGSLNLKSGRLVQLGEKSWNTVYSRRGVGDVISASFDYNRAQDPETKPAADCFYFDVVWDGQPCRVVCAKIEGDAMEQFAAIKALHRWVTRHGEIDHLIALRVNSEPSASPIMFLREEWRDAWDTAGQGLGYTMPAPIPNKRHTYYFTTKGSGFQVRRIYPIPVRGLIHLPLYIKVTYDHGPILPEVLDDGQPTEGRVTDPIETIETDGKPITQEAGESEATVEEAPESSDRIDDILDRYYKSKDEGTSSGPTDESQENPANESSRDATDTPSEPLPEPEPEQEPSVSTEEIDALIQEYLNQDASEN
jgi:hypothetical protein